MTTTTPTTPTEKPYGLPTRKLLKRYYLNAPAFRKEGSRGRIKPSALSIIPSPKSLSEYTTQTDKAVFLIRSRETRRWLVFELQETIYKLRQKRRICARLEKCFLDAIERYKKEREEFMNDPTPYTPNSTSVALFEPKEGLIKIAKTRAGKLYGMHYSFDVPAFQRERVTGAKIYIVFKEELPRKIGLENIGVVIMHPSPTYTKYKEVRTKLLDLIADAKIPIEIKPMLDGAIKKQFDYKNSKLTIPPNLYTTIQFIPTFDKVSINFSQWEEKRMSERQRQSCRVPKGYPIPPIVLPSQPEEQPSQPEEESCEEHEPSEEEAERLVDQWLADQANEQSNQPEDEDTDPF